MTARCREGHDSTEMDYCSVCGAAMPKGATAMPAAASGVQAPTPAGQWNAPPPGACPACGEARADREARYCEVCRYDFVARQPGPPPAARASRPGPPTPTPAPAPAPASAPAPAPSPRTRWDLVVRIDPALDLEPDPTSPCPQGVPEEVVALDRDILVGRRDDRRDIRPELPLNDPGASRRHAKFVLNADGSPALQDLASTNGTKLNDVDTTPGSRTTLKEGDYVTLGRWTRITIRSRP